MRQLLGMAALLVICSTSVAAQQIYRWVDDNGSIHFGGQPPEGAKVVRIEAKAPSPGSFVPSVSKNVHVDDPAQQALDKQVRNEVMAQEAERNQFCEQTRKNLAQLRNNPRLRYADEAGQTHILTEEDRQKRIADAEQSIKDICM